MARTKKIQRYIFCSVSWNIMPKISITKRYIHCPLCLYHRILEMQVIQNLKISTSTAKFVNIFLSHRTWCKLKHSVTFNTYFSWRSYITKIFAECNNTYGKTMDWLHEVKANVQNKGLTVRFSINQIGGNCTKYRYYKYSWIISMAANSISFLFCQISNFQSPYISTLISFFNLTCQKWELLVSPRSLWNTS